MHSKTLAVVLAVAPLAALGQVPAPAQQPQPQPRSTNWQFAVRSGYALPFGKATSAAGDDLSASFSGDVPLGLEVNYRLNPQVYLGGDFQYGFASLSDEMKRACPAGVSCSAHTVRFGVNAFYHLRPWQTIDPWAGIGMNFELGSFTASANGTSSDATIYGLEFLDAQLGFDYQASSTIAFGPFLSASLGQYSHIDSPESSGTISNTAMHGWFKFGLKLSFNP
jgi:opacity protein-like surface antigen